MAAEDARGSAANREAAHPSFAGVLRQKALVKERLSGIRHKIGVYSAKGGVGKTTIAVNLAYALKKKGFRVGLLDADIDCPNLTLFLGMNERMDTSSFPLKPLEKDGVKVASTAMLVDDSRNPMIWRGPIIAKMLYDFLTNTDWGELDYLIIDLPPGTSDAPLTIMQVLDIDGFVIVTTPQRVAAVNSVRSGLMAKKLGRHIIGIVENMADLELSENASFVSGSLGAEIIGRVPFDRKFSSLSDRGKVPAMEDGDISELFSGMAGRLPG
jgi:ATP-binding protein involved in chromosome partitioning